MGTIRVCDRCGLSMEGSEYVRIAADLIGMKSYVGYNLFVDILLCETCARESKQDIVQIIEKMMLVAREKFGGCHDIWKLKQHSQ